MFSHGKCRICPVFMRFPKDRIEKIRNPIGDGNGHEEPAGKQEGPPIEKIRNPIGDGNQYFLFCNSDVIHKIEKIRNPIGDGNHPGKSLMIM